MDAVKFSLNAKGHGAFHISDGDKEVAQMVIGIAGTDMTVYHTEVKPEAEGKGLAKQLLEEMVRYARSHGLKVIALCPYVHAQFKRHRDLYADIWKQEVEGAAEL